jgi:hypothetical protein
MSESRLGTDFLAAYANPDSGMLEKFYAERAVLYTPLTGPLVGRDAIGRYIQELHAGFPGLRIVLHDEFASADGSRACVRVQLGWQNTGTFRGHRPTGRSGQMPETHTFTLTGGQVVEHVVGASGFQLPQLYLADWAMDFPRESADPAVEILSAAPGDRPAAGAGASLARRFADAFGRRDTTTLHELYAEHVNLYTPLAWPARGQDAVVAFALEFHAANPGLRIALHDEFYTADRSRACWRITLQYHNTEPFYGNPPTGDAGVMTETHVVRISARRITEHVVGDNTFHMPHQELVVWRMPFAAATPDPAPPIAQATANGG